MTNKIIFGTGNLHHLVSHRSRQNLLNLAFDLGFRAFDTAPAYGNNINEYELGKALKNKRYDCEINTKFGIPIPSYPKFSRYCFPIIRLLDKITLASKMAYELREFKPQTIEKSLNDSLSRLKTDYIDIFFIHEPIMKISNAMCESIFEKTNELISKGKIKHLGIAGTVTSINNCESINRLEYFQIPFLEINAIKKKMNSSIIAYNIFSAFKKQNKLIHFNEFIGNILAQHEDLSIIISTKSIGHLVQMRSFFN